MLGWQTSVIKTIKVLKEFCQLAYIDQATHPQSLTTKLLNFSQHEAHLILNFKIPFLISNSNLNI